MEGSGFVCPTGIWPFAPSVWHEGEDVSGIEGEDPWDQAPVCSLLWNCRCAYGSQAYSVHTHIAEKKSTSIADLSEYDGTPALTSSMMAAVREGRQKTAHQIIQTMGTIHQVRAMARRRKSAHTMSTPAARNAC